jgi:hypothetical protein
MARAAVAYPSGQKQSGRKVAFDGLRAGLFTVHLAIIAYVGLGWMIPSRGALFFYALFLPAIIIQWLLNGGASIVNNIENLARTGQWNDARNVFEGAFFKTLLHAIGGRASQAQIVTVLCFLMLIFWIAAVCHMILIVVPPV